MKFPNPGSNYIHLLTTESTNDFALDYLSKTIPKDGFFVLADFQTGGKGQYGRKWESEASKNLLVSYIFDSSFLKLEQIFGLHLAGSLAINDLLSEFRIEDIRIKWPNDLLVGGRKIAGILVQNMLKGQQLQYSVFGIGLNLNQTNFEVGHRATSLINLTGQEYPILDMAFKLRTLLQNYLDLVRDGGPSDLLFKYNEQLFKRNEIARFKNDSHETFEAMIKCVDENGMLVLEKGGSLSKHHFGELQWEWR